MVQSDHPELAGTGGDDAAEENADAREHLREALSSALCSLAELLMCTAAEAADEADGEDGPAALATSPVLVECEQLLGEARQLWPRSPEPLQALCSLRRLQGKEEEALAMLRQSLSMWFKPVLEEPPAGEGPVGTNPSSKDAVDADADPLDAMDSDDVALPSYEFRFECARLLLELDPEAMETAAAVLEGLLEENDSVPDVWLLLAVAYREGGELESAAEAAVEGAKVARTLDLPGDHEVVAALEELEQELGKLVVQETGAEGANGGTHA